MNDIILEIARATELTDRPFTSKVGRGRAGCRHVGDELMAALVHHEASRILA